MSDPFIGLTMLVTLSSPPNTQLRGTVSSVVAGHSLTLRNVFLPGNGKKIAEITIKAVDISDLVESPPPVQDVTSKLGQLPAIALSGPGPSTFNDPAILSTKRPIPRAPYNTQDPNLRQQTVDEQKTTPSIQLPGIVIQDVKTRQQSIHSNRNISKDVIASVSPTEVVAETEAVNEEDADIGNGSGGEPPTTLAKKSRRVPRRRQRKVKQSADLEDVDGMLPLATPVVETNKAKGWRQTPLLEPNPSFQPFSTIKRRPQTAHKLRDNGWATEEATDVQDLGDFDFEGNLSKFDKRNVFEGIRADDMTADEDRLVGHNRLAKPGTAGGRNLHYTENVLDMPKPNGLDWNSEAGDSDVGKDTVSARGSGSGRTSRRAESRRPESKFRQPVSRQNSSVHQQTSRSIPVTSNMIAKSAFYLSSSEKRCEVVSALQMLNLENIADGELGLTEDMMTENSARGIAEVILSAPSIKSHPTRHGTSGGLPCVVVLAGNNKSGQRAVSAGRHLRNHGVNVVACVLGLERESELLEGLRKQIKIFRSFGGKVTTKVELMGFIKSLETPVDLIIDGLLGLTMSFEELRTGDQSTAYELIKWANRSKASVLAIDIPTGIDPSSGKLSIIDGNPLYIHAKFVVAMGAPKNGLLQAMISLGEDVVDEWQLFVVDIGIANQAWKKAGTRVRRGIEFESSWVVEMRFQKGVN